YQDQYETKFLESVAVYGVVPSQGDPPPLLFSLTLQYDPGGSGSPVANVTSYSGTLLGDTYKRFLTGIVLSNPEGDSLPGLVFDYYLDASSSAASPGGLKSITYPQGATATYSYANPPQSLNVCDRSHVVARPSDPDFNNAQPRVFFGEDYVVVTWYAQTARPSQ